MLKGKKIVLGITGSIAAYKACTLVRELVKMHAEVQVIMTPSAKEFVAPLTFSTLTGKPVISEFFASNDGTWHSHVDLGLWADLMIVAPATATTLAKMACGVADNMLITTYLSMKAPVMVAPAMDLDMMNHPTTKDNLLSLQRHGVTVIQPQDGFLASGLYGKGRMEEPQIIAQAIADKLGEGSQIAPKQSPLKGKKVMITAGPTYEKIDPVRFIGNFSTGKMGFAIAEECLKQGAEVTLISGPVSLHCSDLIHRVDVVSAEEMYQAVVKHFEKADWAILSAAVADFAPAEYAEKKIKREENQTPILRLKANKDIAKTLGKNKKKGQLLIGFALETNDELANAKRKMDEKRLDMIVLNSMNNPNTCFGSDDNQITILTKDSRTDYQFKSKKEVATDIIDSIKTLLDTKK